eukprot:5905836-Amphidinium_carterae.1
MSTSAQEAGLEAHDWLYHSTNRRVHYLRCSKCHRVTAPAGQRLALDRRGCTGQPQTHAQKIKQTCGAKTAWNSHARALVQGVKANEHRMILVQGGTHMGCTK